MKIVIDSNRLIAALLKDSTTREILFSRNFEFIAPEFIREELVKHRQYLMQKIKTQEDHYVALLSLLFERVNMIPKKEYESYFTELRSEIPDFKDVPYLACCLARKAQGIWTHDPHFLEQKKSKIYTNKELLDILRKL
ncbi:MAG TPA: PIN domain-containing protein [Candidatus Nanoarchaeia archaeon]|nr:PIN domain-containing protein [Candidatus Nanoarchaeia archaeon]